MRNVLAVALLALTACAAKESSAVVDAASGLSVRPVAPNCKASTFAAASPPGRWSMSGCASASDPRVVDSGLLFYDVNVSGWYDGLTAQRYLAIPAGAKITVNADDSLTYPTGTVIVQQLSDPKQLVETRVLAFTTTWTALTYAWSGTDAQLVDSVGETEVYDQLTYLFAPRAVCVTCHNANANVTLGATLGQLNRSIVYPTTSRSANQLDTWATLGLLTNLPATRPQFSPPTSSASLTERARSYLDATCAECHRPGGNTGDDMDLRYVQPFGNTGLCEPATVTIDGEVDPVRVIPGDPDDSALSLALRTTSDERQPPVGALRPDVIGAAVIDSWITDELSPDACGGGDM